MSRLSRLRANLKALRDHDPPEAEAPERATAAELREQSDDLHRRADDLDDDEARTELRVKATELWAAADALVPEERV